MSVSDAHCGRFSAAGKTVALAMSLGLAAVSHADCNPRSFNGSEDEVAKAYLAYYGRAPDAGGLAYWSNRLAAEGGDLDSIIQAFGVSAEFDDRFGDLSDVELVNNLYLQQFGRDAEEGGLNFYLGELRAGRMTLQTISLNIINGVRNNDAVIIDNRLRVSREYATLAEQKSRELSAGAIFVMLIDVFDAPSAAEVCGNIGEAFEIGDSLTRLGVDSRETGRADASGSDLPEGYAPLGSRRTLDKSSELFLGGLTRLGDTDESSIIKYLPGAGTAGAVEKRIGFPAAAWRDSPFNAAAPGDIDGDGLDENVLLWWDPATNAVSLTVIDDELEGFAESGTSRLLTANPSDLEVVTGDFDGDTVDEIVIGVIEDAAGSVQIYVLEGNKQDGFSASGPSLTHAATQSPSQLGVELKAARLDRDPALELVAVFNETWGTGMNGSPGSGQSHYRIYDEVTSSLIERIGDRVSALVQARTYDGLTATAAVGDIDGDNLDEVVIAAITEKFPVTCEPIVSVQFALDDLDAGARALGASTYSVPIPNCESSGNNGWTSHLWADALDMDDDSHSEFHVNGVVFDDFVNAPPFTPKLVTAGGADVLARVPARNIFASVGNNQRLRTTRSNTVVSVGDVSADGFDDIIVYMPGQVPLRQVTNGRVTYWENGYAATVWGIDPLTGEWGQRYYEELGSLHQDEGQHGPPVVHAANVDADSTVLRYSRSSHRVIFTEPVLLAALAAPPCHGDGTQVTDVCRTSWGTGSTTGVSASVAHEVTARHHVGVSSKVSLPVIGDVGTEVEQTVGVSLRAEASLGYETTKTITYTTGPMEDTVVATVIPYDQYSYRILSHPVYPELVGTDLVISLPRSPRTIQVERQFFNDAVAGTSTQVGSSVFNHTIGNVRSYPTRSQMLSVASSGASTIGPVDVGASSGSTSVEISESLVGGFTTSISISFETTVKSTAGPVMSGYTVGGSSTASLGFSVGSSVVFSGTVGDMPPQFFDLDKAYSYGLFAYRQQLPGSDRRFQVINYWVE